VYSASLALQYFKAKAFDLSSRWSIVSRALVEGFWPHTCQLQNEMKERHPHCMLQILSRVSLHWAHRNWVSISIRHWLQLCLRWLGGRAEGSQRETGGNKKVGGYCKLERSFKLGKMPRGNSHNWAYGILNKLYVHTIERILSATATSATCCRVLCSHSQKCRYGTYAE